MSSYPPYMEMLVNGRNDIVEARKHAIYLVKQGEFSILDPPADYLRVTLKEIVTALSTISLLLDAEEERELEKALQDVGYSQAEIFKVRHSFEAIDAKLHPPGFFQFVADWLNPNLFFSWAIGMKVVDLAESLNLRLIRDGTKASLERLWAFQNFLYGKSLAVALGGSLFVLVITIFSILSFTESSSSSPIPLAMVYFSQLGFIAIVVLTALSLWVVLRASD